MPAESVVERTATPVGPKMSKPMLSFRLVPRPSEPTGVTTPALKEALPPACPAGLPLEPLRRWSVDGSPVELIRWDPLLAAPELWVQQAGGGLQRGFRMGAGGLQELGG
jgi:hypothetical protein